MKHFRLFIVFFLLQGVYTYSQNMLEAYQRAEKFMAGNIAKIVYNENLLPNYIADGNKFWYINESKTGNEYFIVDPVKKTNKLAFNHKILAKKLSEKTGKEIDQYNLNLQQLEFINDLGELKFKYDTTYYKYSIKNKSFISYSDEDKLEITESKSPDKKWKAFLKDYNIWLIHIETGDTFQLSNDGIEKYDYGANISWYETSNENEKQIPETFIEVYWSPNSKKLIVPRYDRRNTKKLYLYKSTPDEGFRSEVYSYERPLAGDLLITTIEYVLFDVESKEQLNLNISPNATFLNNSIKWLPSSFKAYLLKYSRGYKSRKLIEINANTGEVKMLLNELSDTYVDPVNHLFYLLEEVGMLLWTSEKSGWNHIYLHDLETGSMMTQVTKGNFSVSNISCINQQRTMIFFTAFGKEKEDIYNQYLYLTDFRGNFIRKITKEEAYHTIYRSPDKEYFVDVYSSYKLPTKMDVYNNNDGEFVMNIAEANHENLVELGWKIPEPFSTKARDDTSDIYGLIFKPSNFDPAKSYPVIDASYSGPHTIRTPKTFWRTVMNNEMAFAELGFIVVTIDGLGTAFRSKKFHDFSYKNLGDIGCEDHVKAIKELAEKYPYMNTDRVGIYGHSAGGYDAVRALILRPDFYQVAVSSAGNHDHRIAKAWWPELYMGYPVDKHYDEQSNILNAEKIEGKLMLAHGNMDSNVNPAGSLRLADELIKANKDFELIITPGDDHGDLYYNKYFIRKRWDFFVTHLLNVKPPLEYNIKQKSVK